MRVQLKDLLPCLNLDIGIVKHLNHELFIRHVIHRVLVIVITILQECIVTLAVSSRHFDLADSSSIGHMTDHT